MCGKPRDEANRPFCSRRCAQVELGRWLTGQYVVPGPPADEADSALDQGAGQE
jgi:endogenous inhibitor of DNA gyrase (YacG/DUF329 family)